MTTPRRSFKSTLMLGAVVVTAGAGLGSAERSVRSEHFHRSRHRGTRAARHGYERACLRIPNLQMRTDNVIARLNGDASTRGSLLWLQAQIDDANGQGSHATGDRSRRTGLKVRTQSLEVLTNRQERLTKLAELCRNHGVDV